MSLVNEMLQDLQEREATNARPLAGLRAVPDSDIHEPGQDRPAGFWLLSGVLVVTGIVAAAWLRTSQPDTPTVSVLPADYSAVTAMPDESPAESAEVAATADVVQHEPQLATLNLALATGIAAAPSESLPEPIAATDDIERETVVASVAPVVPAVPKTRVAVSKPKRTSSAPAATVADDKEESGLTRIVVAPATRLRAAGLAALRGGRRIEAEDYFRQLVALEPGDTEGHLLLHAALKAQSRTAAARDALTGALTTVTQPSAVAQVLARELLAERDTDQAIVVLEQYRPSTLADLEYEATLAAAYQRAGRHSESVRLYGRLVERKPGQSAWLVGMAISQEAGGDTAGARSSYAAAVRAGRLDPALARYARQRLALLERDS
ncbi:MAG: hypothetical protein KJO54_05880 [Gammaproteobacteria bacterium]|nr:hypothetical protein [Gammaproteobacteria bacterium]NNF60012.1 hypothetical protein [Gammaproteobacteria bacterium]NNM20084.1 hypothetical protein [Gammaproteobacteria bacterium]